MLLTSWLKKNGIDVESEALAINALTPAIEAGMLPSLHQALPRLGHEVARARRYERPFSVALVAADDPQTPSLVTLLLAALVREALRDSDIVSYAPGLALCLIGMPETRQAGARSAMTRVQALCLERLVMPVCIGVAEFPVSGWTLEELIKQAELDAVRPPVAAPGPAHEPAVEPALAPAPIPSPVPVPVLSPSFESDSVRT
jgi:hypothetical protein